MDDTKTQLSPLYKDLISRLKVHPKTPISSPMVIPKRVSIKGGVFTCIESNGVATTLEGNSLEAVILTAAPVSRTYYPNAYNPDEHTKPTCWSSDTRTAKPDEDVMDKQAANCLACDRNIKGSGEGKSRACRFHQRIAICLVKEEKLIPEVMQLQLPATSVFGKDQHKMCMQAYLKHLNAHSAPVVSLVTNISFDKASELPRLMFTPVRALSEEELTLAIELKDSSSTNAALVLFNSKSPFPTQEGFVYANEDIIDD